MNNISLDQAVQLCIQGEQLSPEERRILTQKRLWELVSYVRIHSPFFEKAYREVKENFNLSDLPFTTKEMLMKDYSQWVTDPVVTYKGVQEYIGSNTALEKQYLGKYSAITTSGTTGNPMPMVRDASHNNIHGALMQTRLLRETDPDIMTPVRHKVATVIFLDPGVSSYSSFLRMKRAYEDYADNTLEISLMEDINVITKKLNEFSPDFISGYPSVMGRLAKAANEGVLKIHPQVVACSAETLTDNVYQALKSAFGCPVLNNYCSTEGGEAAMSCCEGKLHINEDWIIIEPVDAEGRPVPDGTWSEGLYITDLTNYVQPVIRYYMNDKVRILPQSCSCGSTLPVMEIMGRQSVNMMVGGKEVFGVSVEYLLLNLEGVYFIQLVQTGDRDFEIRMVPPKEEERESIFEQTREILLDFFEEQKCGPVSITMSTEEPIPNKQGGKLMKIITQ